MNKLFGAFGLACAGALLRPLMCTSAAAAAETAQLHYRPLHGDSLRDIARRRLHHGLGAFINPMGAPRRGRFRQLLSWKLLHRNAYGDCLDDQPLSPVTIDWEPIKAHRGVSVTFIKHSSLLIKDQDRILLIDPVFNEIFRFINDYTPLAFDLKDMPRPDRVLITHGHYDHLDRRSLAALDPSTHVITPLGYDRVFNALGMTHRTQLDWFEHIGNSGWEITLLPANHWTMRNPLRGPNRSLWGGYLIKTAGGPVIYVSGDTAYFDGFEQLGEGFDIDLAIFNLGAYAPRWFMAPSHMDPVETVRAFKEIKADKLMIAHWGTFQLGDEPVHFPPKDIEQVLRQEALLPRWIPLEHGQSHFF